MSATGVVVAEEFLRAFFRRLHLLARFITPPIVMDNKTLNYVLAELKHLSWTTFRLGEHVVLSLATLLVYVIAILRSLLRLSVVTYLWIGELVCAGFRFMWQPKFRSGSTPKESGIPTAAFDWAVISAFTAIVLLNTFV
jgi:hypothetical protein